MTPRQLWAEALRSGKYKQGRLKLETEGAYCCLGVACLVAEEHGVPVERKDDGELFGASLDNQPEVQEWLGLSNPFGRFDNPFGRFAGGYLVTLNDSLGKTFEEIADVIESEPKGLFNETV